MSTPKRHHFIPQMLQRRFADADGKLYAFDKRRPECGVHRTSPQNLFVEKHLYSKKEKSGAKNTELETQLSQLEGAADSIIRKIEESATNHTLPVLSEDERSDWDLFFYMQWKRTPDSFENLGAWVDFDETLSKSIDDLERQFGPVPAAELKNLNDPVVLSRIKHNAKVQAVGSGSAEVMQALRDKGLAILKIEASNKSFILGSHSVVKLTSPGHTHISDPIVEIWFPISPRIAISPAYPRGEEKLIPIRDAKNVRHINEAIARQSSIIAGNNEKLITSLSRPR